MTTRPTITIGVQPNTKLLRIERQAPILGEYDRDSTFPTRVVSSGAWMIWINCNIDFTLGTFIQLNDDGTIERVTVHPDGTEDVFVIKKKGD